MVSTAVHKPEVVADPSGPSFNPAWPQTWENLSVVIGIPMTIGASVATFSLAMVAVQGDPLLGWGGIATVLTGYGTTMAALWAGMSTETGRR